MKLLAWEERSRLVLKLKRYRTKARLLLPGCKVEGGSNRKRKKERERKGERKERER